VRNPCIDAAIAALKEVGVHDFQFVRGGKHLQVRWSHRGAQRFYALPGTPSDWRSPLNVRSDIRKMLRSDGLIKDPEPVERPQPPRPPTLEQRVTRLERLIEKLSVNPEEIK
jgi:hypothetical protein